METAFILIQSASNAPVGVVGRILRSKTLSEPLIPPSKPTNVSENQRER